jgi:hypothetical protein
VNQIRWTGLIARKCVVGLSTNYNHHMCVKLLGRKRVESLIVRVLQVVCWWPGALLFARRRCARAAGSRLHFTRMRAEGVRLSLGRWLCDGSACGHQPAGALGDGFGVMRRQCAIGRTGCWSFGQVLARAWAAGGRCGRLAVWRSLGVQGDDLPVFRSW